MKSLFLALFGVFFAFCVVRFCYGLESNTLSYVVDEMLKAAPDVKEDFAVVMEALGDFKDALGAITSSMSSGNIFQVVASIGVSLLSVINVFVAVAKACVYLLTDTIEFMRVVFELFFGEVVSPIVPVKT